MTGFSVKVEAQELGQGNAIFSIGHGFAAPGNAAFRVAAEALASDSVLGDDAFGYRNLGPLYLKGEYMLSDKSGLGAFSSLTECGLPDNITPIKLFSISGILL